RLVPLAVTFAEPFAQDRDGLASEDRAAFLVAFACHPQVRSGAEADRVDGQVDELGYAHASLDPNEEHRVIAAPEPCAAVRRGQQRFDLAAVEVGDRGLPVALGG